MYRHPVERSEPALKFSTMFNGNYNFPFRMPFFEITKSVSYLIQQVGNR
jgi:hypothetical protein